MSISCSAHISNASISCSYHVHIMLIFNLRSGWCLISETKTAFTGGGAASRLVMSSPGNVCVCLCVCMSRCCVCTCVCVCEWGNVISLCHSLTLFSRTKKPDLQPQTKYDILPLCLPISLAFTPPLSPTIHLSLSLCLFLSLCFLPSVALPIRLYPSILVCALALSPPSLPSLSLSSLSLSSPSSSLSLSIAPSLPPALSLSLPLPSSLPLSLR